MIRKENTHTVFHVHYRNCFFCCLITEFMMFREDIKMILNKKILSTKSAFSSQLCITQNETNKNKFRAMICFCLHVSMCSSNLLQLGTAYYCMSARAAWQQTRIHSQILFKCTSTVSLTDCRKAAMTYSFISVVNTEKTKNLIQLSAQFTPRSPDSEVDLLQER